MKKIQNRKIVSLLMVLALVISMLPMTAFAATTTVTTDEELWEALAIGGEIILGADIETAGCNVDTDVELDLNGYTIRAEEGCTDVFLVIEDSTFTVKDSSSAGTGTIDATKAADSAIWSDAGGTITITGGNIKMGRYGIYMSGGILNIAGGTVAEVSDCCSSFVNKTGGTVSAWNIEGGTFNFDPTEYIDSDTYEVVAGDNDTYVVQEIGSGEDPEEVIAWVDTDNDGGIDDGETTYTSLDDIASQDVSVKLATSFETDGCGVSGTVVIDLNGYTITANESCTDVFLIEVNGSLTIKDSSTAGTGTIDATNAVDSAMWYGSDTGIVNIEGGTIKSGQNYGIYILYGTLNISGGYVQGIDCEDVEYSVINITGGTFEFDPSEYLNEGYLVEDNEDGTYTVQKADFAILGTSLALGSSLTMKYYVKQITTEDIIGENMLVMRFDTVLDTVYVEGSKDSVTGQYVFELEGITPQCMVDDIDASLMIFTSEFEQVGDVLISKNDYSVAQYLQSLIDSDATTLGISEDEYDAMIQLIVDLAEYGVNAQEYRNYKTDTLLSNLVIYPVGNSAWKEITDSKKELSTSTNSDVYFTAAGVWFDYVNQLYFKFTAPEDANVTVWIDGEEAYVENIEGTTTYIVYSDAILATEFDKTYEVELQVDGTTVQTLTYGVVSYVYAKQDDWNEDAGIHSEIATLARALYLYGKSAVAYAEAQSVN